MVLVKDKEHTSKSDVEKIALSHINNFIIFRKGLVDLMISEGFSRKLTVSVVNDMDFNWSKKAIYSLTLTVGCTLITKTDLPNEC